MASHVDVIGAGPSGLWAALHLLRKGFSVDIYEQGKQVEERFRDIRKFFVDRKFNAYSNVLFGEGGAGAFSDGKLNTRTRNLFVEQVLHDMVDFGVDESVVTFAKPHIGTDRLVLLLRELRAEIAKLGGRIHFSTTLEDIEIKDGRIAAIQLRDVSKESVILSKRSASKDLYLNSSTSYWKPCEALVLAVGHSARSIYEMLHARGVALESKAFAMGVRIEHSQKAIDIAQYGRERGILPAADYGLHVHLPNGRSAFTFCMCPGGQVFAAASEAGGVVTNGMSFSARDGENANSALLVGVKPEDFPGEGVLAGMYWQREIEQLAFRLVGGTYAAPSQLVEDFLAGRKSTGPGSVQPSYRPGVVWTDLQFLLPDIICDTLRTAIPELGKKLAGFDAPDAVLTGPETRSSSPVRILRGADFSSVFSGLYPCGEGAGYAGGITSAAVDGMRCAEAVIRSLGVDL